MSVLGAMQPAPDLAQQQAQSVPANDQDLAPPPGIVARATATIKAVPNAFRAATDTTPFVQDERLRKAYNPVLQAVQDATGKSYWQYLSPSKVLNPLNGTGGIDYEAVWRDVAAARATNPAAFPGLPATQHEFETNALSRGGRHAADAAAAAKGGVVAQIVGGVGASAFDPVQIAGMIATGGASRGVSIAKGVLIDGLVNTGISVAELPQNIKARGNLGEATTAADALTELGTAFAFGGVAHVGGRAIGAVSGALRDAVNPIDRRIASALAEADLPGASPAVLADAFRQHLPGEVHTPDQAAALHVIERAREVDASNPFGTGYEAQDAHGEALHRGMRAVIDGGAAPRPVLTQGSIIRFVLHDLEGGAAVVHYGAGDGGTTKYGIAAVHNPGVDVANLTAEQAAGIAQRKYWFRELDGQSPEMQAVGFDAGYISGPDYGKRLIRESGGDVGKALELYRDHLRAIAAAHPEKAKYLKGWMHRVDKLEHFVGPGGERVPGAVGGEFDATPERPAALDAAPVDSEMPEAAGFEAGGFEAAGPRAPLRENYVADLGSYAPKLFRETSLDKAELFLPTGRASDAAHTNGDLFFSDHPDMALGQGDNKGVLLEFDSDGLQGQVSTSKPGWQLGYEAGTGSEFVAKYNRQGQYQERLRAVTIAPDAPASKAYRARSQMVLRDLEAAGWTRTDTPQGVRYERPEPLTARPSPEPAEPLADVAAAPAAERAGADEVAAPRAAADSHYGDAVSASFADPVGAEAKAQADGLAHDVRNAVADGTLDDNVKFATGDGEAASAATVLVRIDAEDAALKALRGCL